MGVVCPVGSLVTVENLAEFGVGKFIGKDDEGHLKVHFSTEGTKLLSPRLVLTRVVLGKGTSVRCLVGGTSFSGTVIEPAEQPAEDLYVYRVCLPTGDMMVAEDDLLPLLAGDDPLQSLLTFRWDGPGHYFSRWAMAELEARWHAASGGFPAMLGARIQPLGHQLYAARRVLFDRLPRFILADEVGLGKTIEAGLIIQALNAGNPNLRVLVIAPGSMSRQWLTEFYLRFGARVFTHLDAGRWIAMSAKARSALLDSPLLIVATTALETDPSLGLALIEREWDMVVVDEAHQFPPGNRLYSLLRALSLKTVGLLLLSATPSKRDLAGLTGLLALVAPEVYQPEKVEALRERVERQSDLWSRLNFTATLLHAAADEGRSLDAEEISYLAGDWDGLIEGDEVFDALLDRMRAGDAGAAAEVVAYVQEFHRLDHRLIRSRRATLRQPDLDWAPRHVEVLTYQPGVDEAIFLDHLEMVPEPLDDGGRALRCLYWRFACATPRNALRFLERRHAVLSGQTGGGCDAMSLLVSDWGAADEEFIVEQMLAGIPALPGEERWLKTAIQLATAWAEDGCGGRVAAVLQWLENHLSMAPENQVLVFSQDADAAAEVASVLAEHLGAQAVGSFHHRLPESELAAIAFRFQHDRKCRVLVCDELGGEGRNFQNASAVIHFDLPVSVARLEQRIGRLDRVGRAADRPVLSVVVEGPAPCDSSLLRIHRDVFGVFERSIGGLEFLLPHLQMLVVRAWGDGPAHLDKARAGIAAEVAAALAAVDEAFDRSLDATKPQLDAALDLARSMDEVVGNGTASTVVEWAKRLGIGHQRTPEGAVEFSWRNGHLRVPIPELVIGKGTPDEARNVKGTFKREKALLSENLQFFAPGHQLVDALVGQLDHGGHGRVTVALLHGFPKNAGRIMLHVLGRCVVDESMWEEDGMTPGLVARVRAAMGPEVLPEMVWVWERTKPSSQLVSEVAMRSRFDHADRVPGLELLQPADVAKLPFRASLWDAVQDAVPFAMERIGERFRPVQAARADQLYAQLQPEIGFLTWQARQGGHEGGDKAISARRAAIESVREARIELAGLALIVLAA